MENTSLIKVLVADDHTLVRRGIISLIDNKKNINVIDDACNGRQLVDKYFQLNPDLVLADISMPEMTGIEAIREIKEHDRDVKAICLSMYDTEENFYLVMKAGGQGLIGKGIMEKQLIEAIHLVYKGVFYFGKELKQTEAEAILEKYSDANQKRLSTKLPEADYGPLTEREKEILVLYGEGFGRTEISEQLHISAYTVDFHKDNIMEKLQISKLPQLIVHGVNYISKNLKPLSFL